LWHPKWLTFEKSPSKKSNTVANGELICFGRVVIKSPFIRRSPDPIPLILLLLGQNKLIRRSRQYCSFLMGIFQKFAIWDATRVACGGG
jgi:hypothetical protein